MKPDYPIKDKPKKTMNKNSQSFKTKKKIAIKK
jgi:hypothetical protein